MYTIKLIVALQEFLTRREELRGDDKVAFCSPSDRVRDENALYFMNRSRYMTPPDFFFPLLKKKINK